MWYVYPTKYYSALKSVEILTQATTWLHLKDRNYAEVEWASHKRTNAGWFHLHEGPRAVGHIQRPEAEWWLQVVGGGVSGYGHRVSVWGDEKVVEMVTVTVT